MQCTKIKVVVVGDSAVGKSSLISSYTSNANEFPREHYPTVIDNHDSDVIVAGKQILLRLWDTAGKEEYDRLRPMAYPSADLFLLCYSIVSRASFDNIETKWLHEVHHHCPNIPRQLVACKSDLRARSESQSLDIISKSEGYELAKRYGMRYAEISALTTTGVKECMSNAIRPALVSESNTPHPPVLPPADKPPLIGIEISTFAKQWQKQLENPTNADVTFVFFDGHRMEGHKLILAAASTFFARVLIIDCPAHANEVMKAKTYYRYARNEMNAGRVLGISAIHEEHLSNNGYTSTTIELSADIEARTFGHVLQFLYTGLPCVKDDAPKDEIDKLISAADKFQLPQLRNICENMNTDQDYLNSRIEKRQHAYTRKRMKDMFLGQDNLADVIFHVEDRKIHAHRLVLSVRCDVMAAMFSGHFMQINTKITEVKIPNTSVECFLALLEYMYTDHAPIEEGDSVGILILAEQYGQSRLVNLCELHITKEVDRRCTKNINNSDIDVINLLLMSQMHKAQQLSKWCLHFISFNYLGLVRRPEFSQLLNENLEHVTEHRWPPVSYLEDVEIYKRKITMARWKCTII